MAEFSKDMSWDIFVQQLPQGIKDISEIPEDFQPKLVSRREIIRVLHAEIPQTDFSDPAWGNLEGTDYSIEINTGKEEETSGFALHVRGGVAAVPMVCRILRAVECLGIAALDGAQPSGLFDFGKAEQSMCEWIAYRNQVVDRKPPLS